MARNCYGTMAAVAATLLPGGSWGGPDYPRLANLWGCSPEAEDYDTWSRYDLLVMAGGSEESHRTFRREVKGRNPDIVLLGTAPLMNIGPPESTPWMQDEWYLRHPDGEKVNWWAGQIYAPNLMIDECLAALVDQTVERYGDLLDEGSLDGVFYDSVVGHVSWYGQVDTDSDGQAEAADEINPQWHARQCLFFDRLRERWPEMLILANDVDFDHAPHLHGRLFEGGPLLDQVAAGRMGAQDAAAVLTRWMTDSLQPAVTFAIMTHPLGWQGWRVGKGREVTTPGEVDRVRRDFQRMRTGLLTALMSDAHYAYDFGTVWYGLPLWYAEYDAPLGQPLSEARRVFDVPPQPVFRWQAGDGPESFVLDGSSKHTPEGIAAEFTGAPAPWRRLLGTDPKRVPLEPGKSYRIRAECDILEKPTQVLQFNVRTGRGGWQHHDKGVVHNAGAAGDLWTIDVTVVPDDFDDYSIEWHLLGEGAFRLRKLEVDLVGESYLVREFAGGAALLNPTPFPVTVRLDEPMRRLRDEAAPLHAIDLDDAGEGFSCAGAWEVLGGEGHHAGPTYRQARKPGSTARWTVVSPSDDSYTVFACIPGGDGATDAAAYQVVQPADAAGKTVDQQEGDGGWVELFTVDLREGETCEVLLRSGGTGLTVADALRLESRARYNDGTLADEVTLAPNDGMVLLRE